MSERPPPTVAPNTLDVFIDLSLSRLTGHTLQSAVANWARDDHLVSITRGVTGVVAPGRLPQDPLALPVGWVFVESESPIRKLSSALAAAGRSGVPLLLLLGLVDVNCEAIGVLRRCLERDPMLGFAVPRVGCVDGCGFVRLSQHGVGATEWLPRKVLADLPESELLVEITAPCILIAPRVSGNFGALDRRFEDVQAAMLHYMARARRCGFRTVLSNRALVGIDDLTCDTTPVAPLAGLSKADHALLRQLVPDLERNWRESRAGSWERFERLCTSIIDTPRAARRPSLLLDVRSVGPAYNGTNQAVLGTVNAFKELKPKWDLAILASSEGAACHDLKHVYADWPVYTALPDRPFTAALRPSQPWHIQDLVDLHGVSLFNAYFMLDTIAWDIAYSTSHHLEGTWQFLADHADALLFDSHFTRERFVERFPAGRSVPSLVAHFSFDPSEYVRTDGEDASSDRGFILVIGNNLDHKDVQHTVEALASAFPYRHIEALGPARVSSPFVTARQSGELPERDMHRLYATAQYVVFPSFYEGFGFPILTALAYGRTVLARRSALLEEMAARSDRRGRLIVFEQREQLVELLGKLVHGEPVPEYPLGLGVASGRIRCWRDSAEETLGFLESLLLDSSRSRWIARERAVRQVLAFRTT